MTQFASGVNALRAALTGAVTLPDDPGYDQARTVWNADIDRRLGVIARCGSASDVVAALGFGIDAGLEIAMVAALAVTRALRPSTAVR